MAGKHVYDRRMHRTRRLLHDALGSLLHEKDYDAIVVKEILERADVGRTAFYTHFRGKDALLASGIQQILGSARRRPLPAMARGFEKAVSFSFPLFEHIEQFRHSAAPALGRRGRAILHRHLGRVLLEQVGDDIRSLAAARSAEIPADVMAEYVVSTFLLVLNWWVENRSPLSPRDVDDLFLSLVLPTLGAGARR